MVVEQCNGAADEFAKHHAAVVIAMTLYDHSTFIALRLLRVLILFMLCTILSFSKAMEQGKAQYCMIECIAVVAIVEWQSHHSGCAVASG